jgi:predicted lysophospholipase L1 biosynthesis ABC-type transport system permease subunit
VVALVIGLPLGVALGRWGWWFIARGMGVENSPETVWAVVVAVAVGLLVLANLAAAAPARSVRRTEAATALREE